MAGSVLSASEVSRRLAFMDTIEASDSDASEWMLSADSIVSSLSEAQRRLALLTLAKGDPEVFKRVTKHAVRYGR